LQAENSALTMRRQSAEKQLESLTATYGEMLESRQEIIAQNERLQNELQRITKLGDEVNAERNELKSENWLMKSTIKNKERELELLKGDSEALPPTADRIQPPDYEVMRDRVLADWRVRKAAESKDRIREAIDRFIKELTSWA
jgi:chromosome segregation ATPase